MHENFEAEPHFEDVLTGEAMPSSTARAVASQNHSIPVRSPQEVYSERKRLQQDIRLRVEAAAQAAATVEFAKIQSENPSAQGLGVKVQGLVYSKRPRGFTKVYAKLIEVTLFRSSGSLTQKAILDLVKKQLPAFADYLNANVWTKQLTPTDLKHMKARVAGGELAGKVQLLGVKTLADFRRAIKVAQSSASALNSYDVRLTFTNDTITIGKVPYAIYMKVSGGIDYPSFRFTHNGSRHTIRADSLQALMEACDVKHAKKK